MMEDIPIDKLSPLAVTALGKYLDRDELEEGTWREFAGYAYGGTFDHILEIENKRESPTRIVFSHWVDCESGRDKKCGHLIGILKTLGRNRAIQELHCLYQDNTLAVSYNESDICQITSTQQPSSSSNVGQSSTSVSSQSAISTSPSSLYPTSISCTSQSMTSTSLSSQTAISTSSPSSCTSQSTTSTSLSSQFPSSTPAHQFHHSMSPSTQPWFSRDASILFSFSGAMIEQIGQFATCLENITEYKVVLDQPKPSAWINREKKQRILHEKFKHASFVICLIDEAYIKEVEGTSTSETQTNAMFIMDLMSDEFEENDKTNSRFLPYLLDPGLPKVFPQFLDNPPLGPYEHFQKILAKRLEKIQLQKQLERQHLEKQMNALMIVDVQERNTSNSYESRCGGSLQQFSLTRKNRNHGHVSENNLNVKFGNKKKQFKLKNLFKKWPKPCKATETSLIIQTIRR